MALALSAGCALLAARANLDASIASTAECRALNVGLPCIESSICGMRLRTREPPLTAHERGENVRKAQVAAGIDPAGDESQHERKGTAR
jgi:hypothetical protein